MSWHAYNHYTVEPLLKDIPNKGPNTFNLPIKNKFCDPYSTMAIQFYLLKSKTPQIITKIASPKFAHHLEVLLQ